MKAGQRQLNVWLIKISEQIPLDDTTPRMRTAFLAEQLMSRGHRVLWWTSAFDHQKKDWIFPQECESTLQGGLRLKVLKGIGYKKNISLSRIVDYRLIARRFRKLAPEVRPRPDVIVCAYPAYDLAYEVVRYAKARDIPVIVDLRDQWPDLFVESMPRLAKPLARAILSRDFFLAKRAISQADALTAMAEPILNWGLAYAGRSRSQNDRLFHLGYRRYEPRPDERPSPSLSALLESCRGKFLVSYVGSFGNANSPEPLVQAALKISSSRQNERFAFIFGGKGAHWEALRTKAAGLDNAHFPGWLSQQEISFLLRNSQIGVCTFWSHIPSFPNKVFAYLSEGLPIISSCTGEIEHLIESNGVGINIRYEDVNALVDSLLRLEQDRPLRDRMAERARELFARSLDADMIYREYAAFTEQMALSRPG